MKAVDPQKDAIANLLSIRSGTMTLAEVIGRQGRNSDAFLTEIAATNAKLNALGLVLDSDPRRVTKTGSAPSHPVLSYMSGTYMGFFDNVAPLKVG